MQNCISCSFAKVKVAQDLRSIANDIASRAIEELKDTKCSTKSRDKKKI